MNDDSTSTVYLRDAAALGVRAAVAECLRLCDLDFVVPRGSRVVVKPNLCTAVPEQVRPANTNPEVLEALCEALVERTRDVCIVEADNLRQTADEAFAVTGYASFAQRLGIPFVNLTNEKSMAVPSPAGQLEIPRILFECDVFLTVPVLKTHALTYFTGALKNQWGCVPRYDRILLHKKLDELLVFLQDLLKPRIALMDATVAMEGRGPVNGLPRPLGLLLASRDAVALDATAMRLAGLDPLRARHVRMAARAGLGNFESNQIAVDGIWRPPARPFTPPIKDLAITAMNYFSRYPWFVRNALERDRVFYPVRSLVQGLRQLGLIRGATR